MDQKSLDRLVKSTRPFAHPSRAEIKEFRGALSKLKKAGLIPPNVKISKAEPFTRAGGKSLRDYVRDKDNQAVLRGEAVTVARSHVSDTQGFKVKKPAGRGAGRVIVPTEKGARVKIEHKNITKTYLPESGAGSIKREMLPRKSIRNFLQNAAALPELPKNKRYVFYFYGNKSHQLFRDGAALVEYLEAYDALESDDESTRRNAIRNVEILTINAPEAEQWRRDVEENIRKRRAGKSKKYSSVKRAFERAPEWKKAEIRAKRAAAMRRWRAKQK